MALIQKSLRIPKKVANEIEKIAKEENKDFSNVTNELLEEAVKIHRCPGIVFTEGVKGKRPRIAGSGLEVWEVIAAYQGVGKSFNRLRRAYHWLTEQQLRAALGYYHAYPEEIDALIIKNKAWTVEQVRRKYPFLVFDRE
ncbi:MAG TPA: DUF433 domain-containing protein [Candidatus Manganitrophaceae bacterium]|nr:DUF433 domain-containing protein [Candidatus Manganitrophaceae bacterium]